MNCFRLITLLLIIALPVSVSADKPKIGLILPLSGKAALPGETSRNAAIMANEALGNPLELVFEDNGLDSTRTISAARKLISVDKVQGLLAYASGPSHATAPIAEMAQVPMIGLSVDPKVSRDRKWAMIHWASNEQVTRRLLAELKKRGFRRIAIITTQVQGNLDLEELFTATAMQDTLEIVYKEQVLPTETEFLTSISKMKSADPQAVLVNLYYGQAGTFARQCAERAFRPQFFSHYIFDDDGEVSAANGALDGAFFATTSAGDLSFDNAYAGKHGKRPVLGGISTYDVITIFAEAFRSTSGNAQEINSYLHQLKNFRGKVGTYSALTDNSFAVPAGLGEIQKGKVVKVAE